MIQLATHVELVILRRLDRAILGQALHDADGLVKLGLRHDDGGSGTSALFALDASLLSSGAP